MIAVLKRIIRAGWLSFRRQGGLSLATIFIMVVAISLFSSLFLVQKVSQYLLLQFQEKVDISVYFRKDSSEEDILKLKDELGKIPEVKNVEYVSNKEAVGELVERHPELRESVQETEAVLNLASLNIKAKQAIQYAAISAFLENTTFKDLIEKVDYYQRKSTIEKIFSISDAAKRTTLVLSLIFAIIAVLVAFNTIRLAIYNWKEEIAVQRLVGASNWFIRGPFIIQGIFVGIFSFLASLLIVFLTCYFLGPKLEIFHPGLNLFDYFGTHFYSLLLIQFSAGIGLAVLSTTIAVRKHLRV